MSSAITAAVAAAVCVYRNSSAETRKMQQLQSPMYSSEQFPITTALKLNRKFLLQEPHNGDCEVQ
jgi:hypothetical protein